MAQLQPERFIVPTRLSPDLAVPNAVTYSSEVFGIPFGFTTSTSATTSTMLPVAPALSAAEAKTTSSSVSTPKPNPAMTSTVVVQSDGRKTTVVGYMIPMSTHDAYGRRIKSGIANARTTVPVEPTALAAYSPGGYSYAPEATSGSDTSTSPAPATIAAPKASSHGLSSGQLAAAIVVPIVVVLLGAILGFVLLRRRKRRQQAWPSQPPDGALADESKRGMDAPVAGEKTHLDLPFITSTSQHNYNTGLDSMPPSTASGSGMDGAGTKNSALPTYIRNQYGGSNLSNPFTDASGASSRKDSDAFAGFSGAGTDRSSSLQTTKGDNTPARAVSPVPEGDTRQARQHTHDDSNDNEDAVSDMSDDADYQDGEVEVAQAHMGRSHRASVITMGGMGSGSSPRGSASGSVEGGSPIRNAPNE